MESMSTLEVVLRLLAGVVLTLANAFFVMTEFALTRLPQFDRAGLDRDRRLRLAGRMIDKLEIYLTGCQLGISTTSVLLGVVTEPAVTSLIRPLVEPLGLEGKTLSVTSVVIAVVVINLVHKIWGEQAPTYLGVERPREVARWTVPVHYAWTTATYPLIILGDSLAKATLRLFGVEMRRSWTEAETGEADREDGDGRNDGGGVAGGRRLGPRELKRQMGEFLTRGEVSPERRQEVLRALELGEKRVREIMVPRERVVTLSTARSVDENLGVLAEHSLVRVPLVDGEGRWLGVVYTPALVGLVDELKRGSKTLEDVAVPAARVPAELTIDALIDRLQVEQQELALVEDGDGGTILGVVTSTDAFESIVGDLRDPYDRPQ